MFTHFYYYLQMSLENRQHLKKRQPKGIIYGGVGRVKAMQGMGRHPGTGKRGSSYPPGLSGQGEGAVTGNHRSHEEAIQAVNC